MADVNPNNLSEQKQQKRDNPMKAIRWGIIGVGDVTEVKSGPGFQQAKNSELVAVMRRTGHLAQDYARRHNVPRWYDNADSLVNDPDVNAIYVATPPSSHKKYTLMAAAAGKPVYVEKPMALNFSECREMLSACREANVPLFVAYYRRALDRFIKIKALVDEGAIGEVRFVTINLYMPPRPEEQNVANLPWRVVPEISGGGRFVDLASHQLDFLDFVLGPINRVTGYAANQASNYPAEDIVSGVFEFASGVQGVGTWCFTAFAEFDRTEIIGSAGRISYSTFDDQPVVLTTQTGTKQFNIGYPPHIQQPLIQTVVDDLTGKDVCPSPGESAIRTSWVMDQLLEGYHS
jgi:predicted dehydrogenase